MKICSVSPHQLVHNPRLVREADALAAAGHEVRVISVTHTAAQTSEDAALAATRAWRWQPIDIRRETARAAWLVTGLRKRAARGLSRVLPSSLSLGSLAYGRTGPETVRRIASEPTDLVIAHTQPMLEPAFAAARRLRCRWAFDCEDILSEEVSEAQADPSAPARIRHIEDAFIPKADLVIAASELFAEELERRYGGLRALVLHNVARLSEMPAEPAPGYPEARAHLSLFWFSISIGQKRGIQDVLGALPRVKVPVELHLVGLPLAPHQAELQALARRLGIERQVHFRGRIPADRLMAEAQKHDIALDLMQPCCANHEWALPNKIFAGLAAGSAVIATDTAAHRRFFEMAPGTGALYKPGDAEDLAARINEWTDSPQRLHRMRRAALDAARGPLNWDREQRLLVERVRAL